MIYTVTAKGVTYYSERKMDVIFKHVEFTRRDKAKFRTFTPKAFGKLKGRKTAIGA